MGFWTYKLPSNQNQSRGVSLKIPDADMVGFVTLGHPSSYSLLLFSATVMSGANAGKPYTSHIKDLFGTQRTLLTASYYKGEAGYNYFEILSSSAAYTTISVYCLTTNRNVWVTEISSLTKETEANVIIE